MYQVSNQFKENIVKNARRIKGYIDVHNVIHNFITCTLDDNIYNSETNTFIGSFIAKSGTIKIDYKDSLNLENGSFLLYFGIQLEDETIEYVTMGKMNVYEKISDTEYKFMDNRMYFNNHFDDTNISYPITVLDYLKNVCEQAGCELETISFPNSDFVISKRPYTDGYIPTMSEIVIAIAQISCSFARINRNGNLELNWFTDIDQSYTAENLSSYPVVYEKYGPVNQVILSTQLENNSEESEDEETGENTINQETIRQDDESIETNGITSLKIIDNPIANLDKDKIVVELWNRLKGFEYIPYNVSSMQGQFHLDTGDMIDIETKDGSAIKAIVMNHTMNYSGGISSSISAEAQSENQITYAQESSSNILMNQNFVKLNAEILNVSRKLTVLNAEINNLNVGNLDATYAKIDLSNVGTEYVSNLFVKTGILENATIVDGRITGTLTGVKITGDLIEANTLAVKDLILEGQDGLIYQINAIASGLSQTELSKEIYQQKLNGTDIVANSITATQIAGNTITADKINVADLFAQDITATGTITGLALKGGSININDVFIVNSKGEMTAKAGILDNLTATNFTLKSGRMANLSIDENGMHHNVELIPNRTHSNFYLNTYGGAVHEHILTVGGSDAISVIDSASNESKLSISYDGTICPSEVRGGCIFPTLVEFYNNSTGYGYTIDSNGIAFKHKESRFSVTTSTSITKDYIATNKTSIYSGWIGFYTDSNRGTRVGWIGNNDSTTNIQFTNERNGTFNFNREIWVTGSTNAQLSNLLRTPTDFNANAPVVNFKNASNNLTYAKVFGGIASSGSQVGTLAFQTYTSGTGWSNFIEMIRETGSTGRTIFRPHNNGGAYLGSASFRWNTIFSSHALDSSDLKEKDVIEDFDFKIEEFIMGLKPIAYRRTGEGDTGKRIHMGFGAQDVNKLIKDIKLGDMSVVQASVVDGEEEKPYHGEDIDDAKLSWGLSYNEIIAPLVLMEQNHEYRIQQLEKENMYLRQVLRDNNLLGGTI